MTSTPTPGPWAARPNLAMIVTVLTLAACTQRASSMPAVGSGGGALPDGWSSAGERRSYDRETIYELVDGQADAYFAYNFEQVGVETYQHKNGDIVEIEVWRVATPADAYGLYTINRAGEPIQVGNDAESDPGRRVALWQDRYYVRIRARQDVPDESLLALAGAVAAELPAGGERPALIGRLPQTGRIAGSEVYFHLESSIQDWVWLGGEDILELDLNTAGVLARYGVNGSAGYLVLVEYGGQQTAGRALSSLKSAGLDNLIAASVEGSLVAAVFGDLAQPDAERLIGAALGGA